MEENALVHAADEQATHTPGRFTRGTVWSDPASMQTSGYDFGWLVWIGIDFCSLSRDERRT